MPNSEKEPHFFFTADKEDEFDEDIDNYDNELFNVYDDGIDLYKVSSAEDSDPDPDEDDDEPIEDNLTLPLFNENELDEFDEMDD